MPLWQQHDRSIKTQGSATLFQELLKKRLAWKQDARPSRSGDIVIVNHNHGDSSTIMTILSQRDENSPGIGGV